MIRERQPWLPGAWRFLLLLPILFAAVAITALAGRRHEILAGGPILFLMMYSLLAIMLGRTDVEVDERGFSLRHGPLPTSAPGEKHGKEAVKSVFPRYLRVAVAKGVSEDRYFAAVELTDGRWLNVRGHYQDWAGASAAAMEMAKLWGSLK